MIGIIMVLVAFAGGISAYAHSRGGGHEKAWKGFPHALFTVVHELNLTDQQKHDIAVILDSDRDVMIGLVDAVIAAKKAHFEAIHTLQFNEGSVREASRNLANAEEELSVERARLASRILGVMTQEQLSILEKHKTAMEGKIRGRIDLARSFVTAWIERNK
jgi:Spy/CpxP family protein refolding chaperone